MTRPKKQKSTIVQMPGFDGQRELVPGEVDDPNPADYFKGKKQSVVINLGACNLLAMYNRDQLLPSQYMAATWFQRKTEAMRMGSMAIDPSNEPVDSSGNSDPIPDRVLSAGKELSDACKHVSKVCWPILSMICGEGRSIQEATARFNGGSSTEREKAFVGGLFKVGLDELAVYLGYDAGKRKTQNVA